MLGYCILPLTVAMIVCRIVLLGGSGLVNFVVRLIVVTASFSWSTFGKNQYVLSVFSINRILKALWLFYLNLLDVPLRNV